MNKLFSFTALLLVSLAVPPSTVSAESEPREEPQVREITPAEATFAQLKTLLGSWQRKGSDSNFRIVFDTVAGDSVLVETWMRGDKKHSLTVYHLDGDRLIATHYCPQGNQPRLMLTMSNEAGIAKFSYLDATNLPNINNSHQHSLALHPVNKDGVLIRQESYFKDGTESPSTLELIRAE